MGPNPFLKIGTGDSFLSEFQGLEDSKFSTGEIDPAMTGIDRLSVSVQAKEFWGRKELFDERLNLGGLHWGF